MRCTATAILLLALATPASGDDAILLGRIGREALLAHGESWRAEYTAYEPSAVDVAVIAALRRPAVLEVFLGTWCPDSRREVPRLLKIIDRAAPPGLGLRIYGIDRRKEKPGRLVRRAGLERVPTIILRVGGREVGRIVETPETTLEHDLALLVSRAAGSAEAE